MVAPGVDRGTNDQVLNRQVANLLPTLAHTPPEGFYTDDSIVDDGSDRHGRRMMY